MKITLHYRGTRRRPDSVRWRFSVANPQHVEVFKCGEAAIDEWRHSNEGPLDLTHADLRGLAFAGRTFLGMNLRGADLSGAKLKGALLVGAQRSTARCCFQFAWMKPFFPEATRSSRTSCER